MPSWFTKAFGGDDSDPVIDATLDTDEEVQPFVLEQRRVVHAPVLTDEAGESPGDDIRIKARVERNGMACLFMVDRPLIDRFSAWYPNPLSAGDAPLAKALFENDAIESILIHGANLTVNRDPFKKVDWEAAAKDIGALLRTFIKEGRPIVSEDFVETMPTSKEIGEKLLEVLRDEINPGVAAHSGAIRLDRVEGNTVYIEMQGGCQGCAASDVTLRQGIHEAFRHAVPQVGAILDVTDHSAGTNPYYSELPETM